MNINTVIRGIVLATTMLCVSPVFAAEDATMHEVYTAAQAGKFDEAQAMMDKVLRDHPKSAKAHFVESELLAKQGRFTNAEAEFRTAERLAPGLPFAKPAAVEQLRDRLAAAHTVSHSRLTPQAIAEAPSAGSAGVPWGLLLGGAGLLAFIIFAVRFMNMRTGATMGGGGAGSMTGYQPTQPMSPYGPTAPAPMMGPPVGGGMGSGILGGLATGAAVGAGIVAGEALMHHFTDGNRANNNTFDTPYVHDDQPAPNDMGGTDFGISDSGSWDDGSGSGSDDWS